MKSSNCEQFFTDNNIPETYRRNCSKSTGDATVDVLKSLYGKCPSEIVRAVYNNGVDYINMASAVWGKIQENNKEYEKRIEFSKNCDADETLSCKKLLVKDSGRDVDSSTLAKTSTEEIMGWITSHERAQKKAKAINDAVDFTSLPYEEKLKRLQESEAKTQEAGREKIEAVKSLIEGQLKEAKVQLTCYSTAKQVELACYGLARLLGDPVTIGGGGIVALARIAGIGRGVEAVVSVSRASKIEMLPESQALTRAENLSEGAPPRAKSVSDLLDKYGEDDFEKYFVQKVLLGKDSNIEDAAKLTAKYDEIKPQYNILADLKFVNNNEQFKDGYNSILKEAADKNWASSKTIKELKSYVKQSKQKLSLQKIAKARTDFNSPMHVEEHTKAHIYDYPELLRATNKLAKSGGTQVKEDIFNALKNDHEKDLRPILERYKNGQSLSQTRQELAKLNTKISNSMSVKPVKFTAARRTEVSGRRVEEISRAPGLKTFRANSEDVIAVRERFPNLDRKIEEDAIKISNMKFQEPVTRAEDIPIQGVVDRKPEEMREKLKKVDPKIQQTMVQIWNQMNDPKSFAEYTRALQEDAAVEMLKSGSARELAALNRGEVTRSAVMRVLVKRHRAQGNDQFSTITGSPGEKPSSRTRKSGSNEDFRDAVGQGPFFDRPFNGGRHGVDSHFLQKDYVAGVVYNSTGGKPQEFWNFLGSKRGINYWVPLFDNFGRGTLARPEDLSHILSPVLGISD